MDEQSIERLGSVCLVMGDEFTRLSDAVKAFNDALVADAVGIEPGTETWEDVCNPVEDLRRHLEEMYAKYAMGEFEELAEDPEFILPPRIIPRPPKRTGPVNKANYTANRPPRVARSSCRSIKR